LKNSGPRIIGNTIKEINQYALGIATPNCIANQWAMAIGYFRPNETGTWSIRIESDGMSFLWIGDTALQTFSEKNADVIKNDNFGYKLVTGTVNITAKMYYPIRYIFGNEQYSCASFKIYFARPRSNLWFSDFTGLIFYPDHGDLMNTWLFPPLINAPSAVNASTAANVTGWTYIGWNTTWVTNDRNDISLFDTPANFRGYASEFNGLTDIFPVVNCAANVSFMLLSYFTAPSTGYWGVRAFFDDAGFVWIGQSALNNYTTSNALLSAYTRGLYSGHVRLEVNKKYPIRIAYGNGAGCATLYFYLAAPDNTIWSVYESYMKTAPNNLTQTLGWRLPSLDNATVTEFTNSITLVANVSGILTKYYFPGPQSYYDAVLDTFYRVERGQLFSMSLETYASIGFGSLIQPKLEQLALLRTAATTPLSTGSASYFLLSFLKYEHLQVAEISFYTILGTKITLDQSNVYCLSVIYRDVVQYGPQQAIDDDLNTYYQSENNNGLEYFGVRLPTNDIGQISLATRQDRVYGGRWIGASVILSLFNRIEDVSSQKLKAYFTIPFDPPEHGFTFYFSTSELINVKTVGQINNNLQAVIFTLSTVNSFTHAYAFYTTGTYYRGGNSRLIYLIVSGQLSVVSVDVFADSGFGTVVDITEDNPLLFSRLTLGPATVYNSSKVTEYVMVKLVSLF
jgi:hypothetical protein